MKTRNWFALFAGLAGILVVQTSSAECRDACEDRFHVFIDICTQSCLSFGDELSFHQCVTQFCGDLVNDLANENPQCAVCLSNPPLPGETIAQRAARCATAYVPENANQCATQLDAVDDGFGFSASEPAEASPDDGYVLLNDVAAFFVTEVNGSSANLSVFPTFIDVPGSNGGLIRIYGSSGGAFDFVANGDFASLGPGDTAVTTFTYQAGSRYTGVTDTATIYVTVSAAGGIVAPVAVDDSASTDVNVPVTIAVLANDFDPGAVSVIFVSDPPNGSVVHNLDGSITYTPDPGFDGTDTFDYEIQDGTISDTATVTVTVRPTMAVPEPNAIIYLFYGLAGLVLVSVVRRRMKRRS
jgi:hypothetical protein